jgi:hypothetical protein
MLCGLAIRPRGAVFAFYFMPLAAGFDGLCTPVTAASPNGVLLSTRVPGR